MTTGEVDHVVLGTSSFASIPMRQAFEVLDSFASIGGRRIDTAAFYGRGTAETIIGQWLCASGMDSVVGTKVGHFKPVDQFYRSNVVRHAVHASADRLGTVPHSVLLHDVDDGEWWKSPDLVGGAYRELCACAAELGFHPGISGNRARRLRAVAWSTDSLRILIAKQYDLLWRNAEILLADRSLAVTLAAPLHQGIILDLKRLGDEALSLADTELFDSIREIRELLMRSRLSSYRAAVAFAFAEERASGICIGLSTRKEVMDLANALYAPLPHGLLERLRMLGVERDPRPGPLSEIDGLIRHQG